ncbi:MAG: AAA family ATPase [Theionarchaea archaeon]|nr:AAA family ATPase [Theionarchaea archaeon]
MIQKEKGNMDRVKTSIDGLDDILWGGYPAGTNILVSGASGTGKTIFCAQFLYKGIRDYNENGVYVTLEARPEDLRTEMESLGWDLRTYEDKEKLVILDAASSCSSLTTGEKFAMPRAFDVGLLITEIYKIVQKIDAKRLALDSLPSLGLHVTDTGQIRGIIYRLSSLLLEIGVTSLLTTESVNPAMISRYGVEEFVCRGVIMLDLEERGNDLKRTLRIRKMRGTKHTMRKLPFEVKEDGIVLYSQGEKY